MLAERAGINKDSLSRMERDQWQPTWETVLALASAFGVEVDAFTIAPRDTPSPERGRPPKRVPTEIVESAQKGRKREPKVRRRGNEEMGIETWEDVERHKRSRANASVCVGCGQDIKPGQPIWLLPCRIIQPYEGVNIFNDCQAAGCEECALRVGVESWRRGNCPSCNRFVYVRGRSFSFFCSNRCRNRVYGARFRAQRRKPKKPQIIVPCVVCRRNFAPRRSDANTCSPGCRQKAYRSRHRVTDTNQENTM
jgi:transcriptional regulator with XRE-family HTH domain